jgi:serine phosphatase RsbU (regulator of sigma subunit)
MPDVHDMGEFAEGLVAAESFEEAARWLVSWARQASGAESVLLRMIEESESGQWLPVCSESGTSAGFLRDETIIECGDCICGAVTSGHTGSGPFFTPDGSFVWGRVQSLARDFEDFADSLRGRCVVEGYESLAVCPLIAGDRVVGTLHLAHRVADRFDDIVQLLERACAMAGRVLVRHRTRERELSAFSLIQDALLPRLAPAASGLSVGVSFHSATEIAGIGGDFYEIIDLGTLGVLLLVGDYSGKGLEAAGRAAQARYTLAALAKTDPRPGPLLTAGNRALVGSFSASGYVSCVACLVDPVNGKATFALAGHPPPMLLRGASATEIEAPNHPPLGIMQEVSYREACLDIESGDILLLFTDGVTDARSQGVLFGVHGIAEACRSRGDKTLARLAQDICDASASFHAPATGADDRLVLAVSLAPGAPDAPTSPPRDDSLVIGLPSPGRC